MEKELWQACLDGKVEEVIKLLQNEQININWQDSQYSATPLYIACEKGHIEIVKLLLNDNRVDINKARNGGWTPFYVACYRRHIDIVKLLLNDERVDINKAENDGWTPFHVACLNGYIEILKLLLNDSRVDINKANNDGTTPFLAACRYGQTEVVKYLLECGEIDINKKDNYGKTVIDIVRERGNTDIVKYENIVKLIESFRDRLSKLKIWQDCSDGNVEEVRKFLENSSYSINLPDKYGQTPLWIACDWGHTEVVKLLLNDESINVNKADAFSYACQKGKIDIVKLLLNDKRVDIKANHLRQTPFCIACRNGQIETVKHLLACERELDINQKDEHGKTALDYARKEGKIDIVELIESFQKNPKETRTKLKKELDLPKGQSNKLIEYFPLKNWNDIVSLNQGANDEYRIEIDPDEIPPQIKTQIREIMEKFSTFETCIRYKATPSNFIFQVEFIMKSRAEKVFDEIVELLESDQ